MGELHLDIYVERMKREYGVVSFWLSVLTRSNPEWAARSHVFLQECKTGEPRVNFRETITQRAEYSYLHRKQTGGAGQFARVIGYIEPMPEVRVLCVPHHAW
jgi:elongation factor G